MTVDMLNKYVNPLTLWAAYCLCHHWSKKWIGADWSLSQCWLQIEKKPRNNLRWNSCLSLRISLRKIKVKFSSVFSCQISPGLNVLIIIRWTCVIQTLVVWELEYSGILSQYHTCRCPGGKCRQGISRYNIDRIHSILSGMRLYRIFP